MAERRGWQVLEEAVREIRARTKFDAVKADTEARAQFAVAKKHMYKIGAVNLMRGVAPLLPDVTLMVSDDFDQAGGKGMSPCIILQGPTRDEYLGEKISCAPVFERLVVYPLVFQPEVMCITVERSTWRENPDGRRIPSSYMIWDTMASSKNELASGILNGVKEMLLCRSMPEDIFLGILSRARDVLGLTASVNSIPPFG